MTNYYTMAYNEDGNMLQTQSYNAEGELIGYTDYIYDAEGNQIGVREYRDGVLQHEIKYHE